MDTSKTYALMSKNAIELQSTWDKKIGDIVIEESGMWCNDDLHIYYNAIILTSVTNKPLLMDEVRDYILFEARSLDENKVILSDVDPGKIFWLPRQDQLQDMVLLCGGILNEPRMLRFLRWLAKANTIKYMTMEQLTLEYVMETLYYKTWNTDTNLWNKLEVN